MNDPRWNVQHAASDDEHYFDEEEDTPRVTEEEKQEALDVLYSTTEACPMCGVVHPC